MCGICGQYNFGRDTSIFPESLKAMTSAIAHRGPDDQGLFCSEFVGLGFRRLSIIDLTGGRQPMSDADESVWVVFNGEIYNFRELRTQLVSRGHVFRTQSDTEVIVHGYKEWGDDVLIHLNGMFGLAIWDVKSKRLILARDRMGVKPLYYRLESSRVLFGSEIRAILAVTREQPEIDPEAIGMFLQYRYVPSPFTVLKGIRKLAPGTRLVIGPDREPRLERWWTFAPSPFDPMPSDEQATEKLLELYVQAVRRQLISDVPVGLLLSGGLDSGLLLGLMKRFGNSWRTYTVGYGKTYADDELSDAAFTAQHFGAPNFDTKIDRRIFEATLEDVTGILEEPVTASSVVPMYHLCKRARTDVKVVLMGQGPDELLGGYTRHLGTAYGSAWRSLPVSLRRVSAWALGATSRSETLKRALYSLDTSDRMQRYQRIFSIVPPESIGQLFQDGILSQGAGSICKQWEHDLFPLMQDTDELGGLQFLEVRSSLPDELLTYADKISMAHGLEVRVPYLDQDVVEYVERLDASFKVRHGAGKWLHRKVAGSLLPATVLRRKKRGFESDVNGWFRQSLAIRMNDIFEDGNSQIYRYLRRRSVTDLVAEHRAGKSDNSKILFSLVILEHTLRNYFSYQRQAPISTTNGAQTYTCQWPTTGL
jgi:asparagine synthase (glutamine-hydrolysing)